ncbi:MAG: methyltransferase domain-containing protein [Alphaproteobacteria bacterium]|nr:methyltransferase domain-containing protein [Alphaproteobacteria bacterium]
MFIDVVDLRDFYERRLGGVARQMIGRRVRRLWPDLKGMRVLGLGYATPYLRPFIGEAERVIALMPAQQGVLPWPPQGPNRAALAEEGELPLPNFSMDRVLVVHGIEFSEQVRPLLKEIWRVLAGGGRLVVVVPNRRGIWTRFDHTPFGQGNPYTTGQLTHLLRDEGFTPERSAGALFVPPTVSRFLLRSAGVWERIGELWFGTFAGVVVVEATKQIYAAKPKVARLKERRVLLPIPGTPSPAGP